MNTYPLEILMLLTSPGHNYFGNRNQEPGEHPTLLQNEVETVAGKGLVGDRFYNIRPNHRAQVTFFAIEVWEALRELWPEVDAGPEVYRRNIVVRGVDLKALIGQTFRINGVEFEGTRHCAPCKWMNRVFHPESLKAMRGRGGLQARVLSNGKLTLGKATLSTHVQFNSAQAAEPITYPRLPG